MTSHPSIYSFSEVSKDGFFDIRLIVGEDCLKILLLDMGIEKQRVKKNGPYFSVPVSRIGHCIEDAIDAVMLDVKKARIIPLRLEVYNMSKEDRRRLYSNRKQNGIQIWACSCVGQILAGII